MTKHVLFIKLTSMGDLMHALPALTDACKVYPGIRFDWVVDAAFAEVISWHPAVDRMICSSHRQWKKQIKQSVMNGDFLNFYRQLNESDYDVVLDGQNNLKSAVVCFLRRGKVHGFDKQSVSEKPAHYVHRYQYASAKSQHAVARQRQLMADSLGYEQPDTMADYGIDTSRLVAPTIELPDNYLFFVHNASWSNKLWPETHWHALIKKANDGGFAVVLPCGNEEEYQRAKRLAAGNPQVFALPKLPLSEVAWVLHHAHAAVCCDTGLGHMAAMLEVPAVSFYGPTSEQLVGTVGKYQQHIIASKADFPCAPCYQKRCAVNTNDPSTAACMQAFSVDSVWGRLRSAIAERQLAKGKE